MCGALSQSGLVPAEQTSSGRQALAELLNDGPLQELTALRLKADNLARLGHLGHVDRVERLHEISDLAQLAVDQITHLIRRLATPEAVPVDSLYPRFMELCEDFRSNTGLRCELQVSSEHLSFRSDLADVIFRTVRELLANVRKHARASTVHISSERRSDGDIAITIEDDGIGFRALNRDPNSFGSGFWLRGIDQRLGAFGALLDLDGGTGLRATVVVPGRLLQGRG